MIWVCVHGGVKGFPPEEIEQMEREFRMLPTEFIGYWGFFNWFFADDIGGNEAFAYSALWTDQDTYKRMSAHTDPAYVWGRGSLKCSDCHHWYCNYDLEAKPAEGEPLRCQQNIE